MKLLKIFFKCIICPFIFFILGKLCNSGLSTTNILKISENMKIEYKIPFVITISFLEGVYLVIYTLIFNLLILLIFKKDFFRIRKITKNILVTEIFLFLFICGTNQYNLDISLKYFLDLLNVLSDIIFKYHTKLSFFLFFLLAIYFLLFFHNEKKETYRNNLYNSRERYLPIIDFYLENMKAFSIIGKWGIGKTKLIENFFKGNYFFDSKNKYSEKYEFIYIDVSIYSDNKKIIELLQKELGNLLKKYGFLDLKGNFIKNIFLESEGFLKIIYNFIFSSISLENTKIELNKKVCKISDNKKIVVCLDNLERINDKNRIVKLFAILDEILPEEIKRIYIYDEGYMKKIFEKENENFIEYISKYVFNKIVVDGINIDEVLTDRKDIAIEIEKIRKNLNINLRIVNSKIDTEFNSYTEKTDKLNTLKEKIKEKFEELNIKLNNPRYLNNLKEYIGDSQENINYKLEYKIIRDNFFNLNLDTILNESLELTKILNIHSYKLKYDLISQTNIPLNYLEISDETIEKICQMYIFEVKDKIQKNYLEGINDFKQSSFKDKKIFFESYYNNIKITETTVNQKLEKYKENPEENFFEIIDILKAITPTEKLDSEIKKFLDTINIIKYELSKQNIFKLLDYLQILNIILPKLVILYDNENFEEDIKNILIYLLKTTEINALFNIKFDLDTYKTYLNSNYKNTENLLKEKLAIKDLKEIPTILRIELDKNINLIAEIKENFYEEIKETIEVFEKFCNIKKKYMNKVTKITDNFFRIYNYQNPLIKDNKFIIYSSIIETNYIEITNQNIDDYLSQFKKLEEIYLEKEKNKYIFFKINLLKFKNMLVD